MTPTELKQEFKNLSPIPSNSPRFSWLRRRWEIRRHVENEDIKDFLNWSTIQETMFVGNAPYIQHELDEILFDSFWWLDERRIEWNSILTEPMVGNPELFSNSTSGNLIHQAYHIKQWMDETGRHIQDLERIVEIGGGYGAMCLICRRLGFKGQYVIIDLPEFSLLQEYYLSNTVGMENVFLCELDLMASTDLCIGLWSISEIPEDEREGFLPEYCKSFLFAYAPRWNGVDNKKWFEDQRGDMQWKDWKIEHLPNSRYRIGWIKE